MPAKQPMGKHSDRYIQPVEYLTELSEGNKIIEAKADAGRITEFEAKLAGLSAETDDCAIVSHIENGLDHLDVAEDRFG